LKISKTIFRNFFSKKIKLFLGVAKFIDTNLTEYKNSSYVKTMLGVTKCPLSPEQLESLRKNSSNPNHEVQAVEAWQIGILLLTMASLSSEEVIYNWREKKLDERGFNHLLSQIEVRYSPLFVELVNKCLDFDPEKRPSLATILTYLTMRKQES